MPKWYGLAWYRDQKGEKHTLVITLTSPHRHEAEREARRVCRARGYLFEGVYPVLPQRYQQRKKGRQKPAQANLWWKQRPAEEEATGR